jgi:beta-mannosidase
VPLIVARSERRLLITARLLQGHCVSENTAHLVPPKHLELHDPELKCRVLRKDGNAFIVQVRARRPALFVQLDAEDAGLKLEDNWFTLLGDEAREVRVTPKEKTTKAELQKRLRARSLFDTYE